MKVRDGLQLEIKSSRHLLVSGIEKIIEVSQLEASISGLRGEVANKRSVIESLEKR